MIVLQGFATPSPSVHCNQKDRRLISNPHNNHPPVISTILIIIYHRSMNNGGLVYNKLFLIEKALSDHSTDDGLSYGLFSGLGGVSLFYYTLYSATSNKSYLNQSVDYLNKSITVFEKTPILPTYCSGLAGLASLIIILAKDKIIANPIDKDVNEYLYNSLIDFLEQRNFDFLHGAIGIATYFVFLLSLIPNDKNAVSAVNLVLNRLNETKEVEDDICKWIFCDGIKQAEYNISMSHGMSAIVVFLSRLLKMKFDTNIEIERLCRSSINYINSQMLDVELYGSYYPYASLATKSDMKKSRLAWCYGDLGIAIAQYNAGLVLNDKRIIKHALSVLSYSAIKRREQAENGVFDAGLCHGASGIAHCFYRLFLSTGMPMFKEATDYWINVVMNLSCGDDYAGYLVSNPRGEDYHSIGLLNGLSGIGLSLISYLFKDSYRWDSFLNISL